MYGPKHLDIYGIRVAKISTDSIIIGTKFFTWWFEYFVK